MSKDMCLRLYLEQGLRNRVDKGHHNFLQLVISVAQEAGLSVELRPNTEAERSRGASLPGFNLTHMKPPPNARSLVFRKVYHTPFWQIDPSDQRWNWSVARSPFDASIVDQEEAERFFDYWRNRLFAALLPSIRDDGFVYMPLQGRLLSHRSFQSCSPIEMIRRTRAEMPERRIVATLHPKEQYSAVELETLDAMVETDPLLELQTGGSKDLLPACHCIVTQNSSVAFDGFFFRKPAVLFAGIDFHHIAHSGTSEGFAQLSAKAPNYAAYIWWFWQQMSINAGHKTARTKIVARLRAAGWPVK